MVHDKVQNKTEETLNVNPENGPTSAPLNGSYAAVLRHIKPRKYSIQIEPKLVCYMLDLQ